MTSSDIEKGEFSQARAVPIVDNAQDAKVTHVGRVDEHDRDYDAAAVFLADLASRPDAETLMAPWSEAEERAVRRRLDCIVLPLITVSLLLGGTDKVALGTSATFGLKTDMNLVGQQYSWSSSIIFFGSMIMVFPQTWLCQRFPTGRIFAINVFFFGVMSFATMGCRSAPQLMAVRFILGLFEGVNTSGAGLVINMWWKKNEHGWRTVVVFNTFSSVVNGLLSYAVQFHTDSGGLKRWQLLYLILGCVSCLFGVLDWFCLPSNPAKAWWLTDRQKFIAVQRIASNKTGMVNHHTKWHQIREAVLDIRTWLYFLVNITLNIPNGGLNGFYSIIVAGFNFPIKKLTLMNMPTGVISWLASLFWVTVARYSGRPLLCSMGAVIVCLAGTIALKTVPHENIGGSLASLYIVFMYWAPYMTFGQLIMYANVGGASKKVTTFSIAYLGYCVGNLIGPQAFRAKEAPGYTTAYTVMMSGYCVSLGLMSLYGWLCWRDNRTKEVDEAQWRSELEGGEVDLVEEWRDLTDKENPRFRYTF